MASSETTTLSLERYAPDAKGLVAGAQAIADERKHAEVLPLHLLTRSIERDPGVAAVFRAANVNVVELQSACERAMTGLPTSREPAYLSASMPVISRRKVCVTSRDRSANGLA